MKTPNQIKELTPKLSSAEILDKEFRTKFRGYDPVQVNAYLDTIIQDYDLFEKYFTSVQDYINDLERAQTTNGSQTIATPIELKDLSPKLQETINVMNKILDKKRHTNRPSSN